MPLQKRIFDFPFVGGARQDIDPRVLPFGALKRVENRRYTKDGRLARRYGFEELTFNDTSSAAITDPIVRLASLGDERVVIGEQNVYSQLPSTSGDWWADRGWHPRCGNVTRRSIYRKPGRSARWPGVVVTDAYRIYCWVETGTDPISVVGDVWVSVHDRETGGLVFRQQLTNSVDATLPRIIDAGGIVWVLWVDISAGSPPFTIDAAGFDTADSTPTAFALTEQPVPNLGDQVVYDVDVINDEIYLAFQVDADNFHVARFDNTLSLIAFTDTGEAAGATTGAAIYCTATGSGRVWVAYVTSGPLVRCANFPLDLSAMTGPFTLNNIATTAIAIGEGESGGASVYYVDAVASAAPTPTSDYIVTHIQHPTLAGTAGGTRQFQHVRPASKPFMQDGKQYMVFATYSEEFQSVYALCDTRLDLASASGQIVPHVEALFGVGESGVLNFGSSLLGMPIAAAQVPSESTFVWAAELAYDRLPGAFGELTGVGAFDLPFADARRFLPVRAKESLAWSGGLPTAYDGSVAHEIGFAYAPEGAFCAAADAGATGGLVDGGTYTYFFVYEWYDAKGQRHLSRPGPIEGLTHTLAAGQKSITLRIQTLSLTNKHRPNAGVSADAGTPVRILVYRNNSNGTVWHLVQSQSLRSPENDFTGTTGHSVTFTDNLSFDGIQQNEALYITDGSFPNDAPGAMAQIVSHRDRLFGFTGDTLYWTKRLQPNGRAAEWSQLFAMKPVPGVPITAIASLDAALVIFTADQIYLLGGEGPEDDGGGQQYQPPELHSSDVGCIEPRSLQITREGLVFQSKRGIEMLPRGFGAPIEFGAPVQDDFGSFSTITSTLVVPDQTQVRLAGDNATTQRQLCWDYSLPDGGGWSVYSFESNRRNISAVMWGDRYTFTTGDALFRETRAWTDPGEWITTTVETGDLLMSGLNGWGRIYDTFIKGEIRNATMVVVEASYDGGVTWSTPQSWEFDGMDPAPGSELKTQYVHRTQPTNALRLRITDAETARGLDSEGVVLNGCSLVWGQKRGPRRIPESLRR